MTSLALQALGRACQARGLRTVARQLALSPSTLSLINRGLYMAKTERIEARVRQHLGADIAALQADWLQALRMEAKATTQAQAGERLGISEATASQVLSGSYGAATTRIERRVRGELLGATCACPVMGEVSTRVCQDVQERKPPIANPQHAQAWFACRGRGPFTRAGQCPHFNGAGAKPTPTPTKEQSA